MAISSMPARGDSLRDRVAAEARAWRARRRSDRGASAVEYALLCAGVAAAIVVPVQVVTSALRVTFGHVVQQMTEPDPWPSTTATPPP